jgi:hypothetical protein
MCAQCIYKCAFLNLNGQNHQLYDAAKEGNLPEALAALDRGADVNCHHHISHRSTERKWVMTNSCSITFAGSITS